MQMLLKVCSSTIYLVPLHCAWIDSRCTALSHIATGAANLRNTTPHIMGGRRISRQRLSLCTLGQIGPYAGIPRPGTNTYLPRLFFSQYDALFVLLRSYEDSPGRQKVYSCLAEQSEPYTDEDGMRPHPPSFLPGALSAVLPPILFSVLFRLGASLRSERNPQRLWLAVTVANQASMQKLQAIAGANIPLPLAEPLP